ncbi:MAG: M15 family metallopeptidase [Gammaproteobacteria bacterium]
MKVSEIKQLQEALASAGHYTGGIDGKQGPRTNQAIAAALTAQAAKLPADWPGWSNRRMAVACLQLICHEHNIDAGAIDGFYGPQTEYAIGRFALLDSGRPRPRGFTDIVPLRLNPHQFPLERAASLTDYYGEPCQASLTKVTCPWRLRLDWNLRQSTRTISIHHKLSDSLATVLENIYQIYGEDGIRHHGLDRYGGSYNCRNKRGSDTAQSTHAWGIAIDWFPSKNKLRWNSAQASLSNPELDAWWECWEQEGWLSLGRSENRDWMHVQAAKR